MGKKIHWKSQDCFKDGQREEAMAILLTEAYFRVVLSKKVGSVQEEMQGPGKLNREQFLRI